MRLNISWVNPYFSKNNYQKTIYVKNELYDNFVEKTKEAFKAKFGRSPKVYDVVIGDCSRKVDERLYMF